MKTETAVRKVQRAIDMMVDLQDAGFGCDSVTRILEMLRSLESAVQQGGAR